MPKIKEEIKPKEEPREETPQKKSVEVESKAVKIVKKEETKQLPESTTAEKTTVEVKTKDVKVIQKKETPREVEKLTFDELGRAKKEKEVTLIKKEESPVDVSGASQESVKEQERAGKLISEVKAKQTKPKESEIEPKSKITKQEFKTTAKPDESVADVELKARPIKPENDLEIKTEVKQKEEPVPKKKTEASSLLIKTKAEEKKQIPQQTALKGTTRNIITTQSPR